MAQQLRKWLADPADSMVLQVPRALIASVLAAVVDCAILFFLADIANVDRVPAAIIGYLAGSAVQFFLCARWVFAGAPQAQPAAF